MRERRSLITLRFIRATIAPLRRLLISSTSMSDDEFEWDDRKAAENYLKHGISFEVARDVFKDPFAIDQADDRDDYGENRHTIIGMVDDRLLFVAYTMRGEIVRIISARGAEPHERRQYHEEDE